MTAAVSRQTERQTGRPPPLTRACPADTGMLPSCLLPLEAAPPLDAPRRVKLLRESGTLWSSPGRGPVLPSPLWCSQQHCGTRRPLWRFPSRVSRQESAGAGTRAAAWMRRLAKLCAAMKASRADAQVPLVAGGDGRLRVHDETCSRAFKQSACVAMRCTVM